jgi:hypothetical protein
MNGGDPQDYFFFTTAFNGMRQANPLALIR